MSAGQEDGSFRTAFVGVAEGFCALHHGSLKFLGLLFITELLRSFHYESVFVSDALSTAATVAARS